jgi:hypothetical protein
MFIVLIQNPYVKLFVLQIAFQIVELETQEYRIELQCMSACLVLYQNDFFVQILEP